MSYSNKWNRWLFNTATTWSENHLDLPIVDLHHANKINNMMMKIIFNLNNEFNQFNKNINPKSSNNILNVITNISLIIKEKLKEKESLVIEINRNKRSQYKHNHEEIISKLDSIENSFKNGQFNKSQSTSSDLLVYILDYIEHNDKSIFSINRFIEFINFTDKESFTRYISFCEFPSIKNSQTNLIEKISHFHTHYIRREDDFFTLEELFKEIIQAMKNMIVDEKNIIEKFDIKCDAQYKNGVSKLDIYLKSILEKLTYRTELKHTDLKEFYKHILYHFNQDVFTNISLNKINPDYFSGFKNYSQISELFKLEQNINEWAEQIFTRLQNAFSMTPDIAINELTILLEITNQFDKMLATSKMSIKVLKNKKDTKHQLKTDKLESLYLFINYISQLIDYIKTTKTNKGSDFKNLLTKQLALVLFEVSNER